MKDARINPAQAFAHPLWLGALLLLILNDHVLKGSGWMPGAITGKLSDFAGLIVAPAVLSVLLRTRTRRSVLACACAIFAVFTLIKLSQASADLLAFALSKIGVAARIYADPSDLLALPMLWLGVRLQEDARPLHTLWRLTAFSIGLWACLATSANHKVASSAVVNHRAFALAVRVREAELDCEDFNSASAGALTGDDFPEPWERKLEPQEHLALGEACGAAWVTIGNVYDGVIAWDHFSTRDPALEIEQWLLDRSLVAEGTRTKIKVTAGKYLHEFPRPGT